MPADDELQAWLRSAAPPQTADEMGRLGQFAVRRLLGRGGMGAVFAADDLLLRRAVAVKVMRPHLAATADAKERFLREARAAATLDHKRVVPIYHVGEAGGVPYLIMPLLNGEALEARLRRRPRLPPADVLRIGRELAEGLAAAHSKGLVHRDVKPANVWLKAPGGSALLLDFGLARAAEPGTVVTQPGSVVGTPAYMAPEQVDGPDVDARADLFSLGVVLYEICTGRQPFAGRSTVSVLHQVVHHVTPRPHEVCPEVPAALSKLVMGLLAKDPAGRPASAAEVAAGLRVIEQAVAGSTASMPIAARTPQAGWSRRRIVEWAAAAGAAVVAVLLFAVQPWSGPADIGGNGQSESTPPPAVEPLRVVGLDVHHFARQSGNDGVGRGVLGKQSFGASVGDRVTIEARLSRAAYAYLIACRADGVVELCFPEDQAEPPPLTDRPRYPSKSRGKHYGLDEGAGLWVFAVVASDAPLLAYKDWLAGRTPPWSKTTGPAGTVWLDDGQWVEAVSAGGTVSGERAKGVEAPGRSAVVRVTDWLKTAGAAAAVGVTVEAK